LREIYRLSNGIVAERWQFPRSSPANVDSIALSCFVWPIIAFRGFALSVNQNSRHLHHPYSHIRKTHLRGIHAECESYMPQLRYYPPAR
jgi:hypothetical protein